MKLPITAAIWKNSLVLAILFLGVGLVCMLDRKDFTLAPAYTDMIGMATLDNIQVSSRVVVFTNAIILFFILLLLAFVIQYGLSKVIKKQLVVDQVNRFAIISTLLLFQQALVNEVDYFFILFFGVSVSAYILIMIFKSAFAYADLTAVLIGLVTAVVISTLELSIEILFSIELILFCLYKYLPNRLKMIKKVSEKKMEGLLFMLTGSILFICFFLLLVFWIDLFNIVQYIQREKKIPNVVLFISLFPLAAFYPVYRLLKSRYSALSVHVVAWFCFALFFIVAQFADNYLPALLMLLVFLIKAASIKERKTLEYYLMAADVVSSLSVFYLMNLLTIDLLNDYSKFFIPFLFLLLVIFRDRIWDIKHKNKTYKYLIPVASTPLLLFFTQELVMLLNQHNVFLYKGGYWLILFLAYTVVFIIVFFWNPHSLKIVFAVVFPVSIAGIAIYNSYSTVWLGGIDFFEEASSAVAIKRIYMNGELPVFEQFSPHNLNDFITGLLYVFLNNDLSLGYKLYNCIYALFFLVYYFLFSTLFKSKFLGFFWTIFSGAIWIMLPIYHAIAVLAFMSLYWYFKSKYRGVKVAFFSIVLLFTLFFRADTGVAILAAIVVSTPFFVLNYGEGVKKIKFLAVTSVLILLAISMLVLLKVGYKQSISNVQMVLGYFDSAQSWGYSMLTRVNNFKFRVHYFVFPILIIAGLIYVLAFFRTTSKSFLFGQLCLVYFSVYYLVNYQRGLIRHSFLENHDVNVSSYVYFLIGLLTFLLFFREGGRLKFIGVFLVTVNCCIWLFKFPRTFENRSLYTAAIDKIRTNTELPLAAEKVKRFDPEALSKVDTEFYEMFVYSRIDQLRNVYKNREEANLDFLGFSFHTQSRQLLQPNRISENYFPDLLKLVQTGVVREPVDEVCYEPMINYFINKKSIHFFNQGIHFYHTKNLQQKYIKDLIVSGCKYVLVNKVSIGGFADYLDDVPHSIRHYDILQHIYENYKPIAIIDKKTLWVKDSIPLSTNPLFQYTSATADSFYQFSKPLPLNGRKVLLTIYADEDFSDRSITVNGKISYSASFKNKHEQKTFVMLEGGVDKIRNVLLPIKADSIAIDVFEYFPDIFTQIPLTYNLKQLPYVLGQSTAFKKVGEQLKLNIMDSHVAESFLNNKVNLRGAALNFTFSSKAKEDRLVKVQYFEANRFLGEYEFLVRPGMQISYLLQIASQPNWNLARPDRIKITGCDGLYLDDVHLIAKDELSY